MSEVAINFRASVGKPQLRPPGIAGAYRGNVKVSLILANQNLSGVHTTMLRRAHAAWSFHQLILHVAPKYKKKHYEKQA